MSGIVGNDWYDRESGKVVARRDATVKMLGGDGGCIATPILVSTVGELEDRAQRQRVVGISLAIAARFYLPTTCWQTARIGSIRAAWNFVSSTYYLADLPEWVKQYDASRPADGFRGAHWRDHTLPSDNSVYAALEGSPFGNDFVWKRSPSAPFGLKAGPAECHRSAGREFFRERLRGTRRGDRTRRREGNVHSNRSRFLANSSRSESTVGMGNVLVVMTADHGVSPVPEVNVERKMPGGRLQSGVLRKAVEAALTDKYGAGCGFNPSDAALSF